MNIVDKVNDTPPKQRPKVWLNGTAQYMTDEQYADYLKMQAEIPPIPEQPSPEERILALEQELADIRDSYERGVNDV